MNYIRLGFAALAGTVAYFATGFLVFGLWIANDYRPFTAVYRPAQEIMHVFPIGIAATFAAIFVLGIIYAKGFEGGRGFAEGARFGMLVGVFSVCAFVIHNYVNLNISVKLTVEQAVGYFVEWTIVGIVIGLIYKPATHAR